MDSIRVWMSVVLLFFISASSASAQKGPEGDGHVIPPADPTEQVVSVSLASRPGRMSAYVPGRLDESVWDLQSRVKDVRQQWLAASDQDNAKRKSIHDSALGYVEALVKIPNNALGLGALIVRDEYACFGLIIAAANSNSLQTQRTLGRRAEALCVSAATHLDVANELASNDSSARAVFEWSRSSDEQPRVAYLSAMSSCLQSTNASNDLRRQAARRTIQSIPEYYLTRYPPVIDVVLKRCVAP